MEHQQTINNELIKKLSRFPWLIPSMCDGCASCVNSCHRKVLFMEESEIREVYYPQIGEYDKCIGCGKCADACAMGAVVMTSYVEKAIHRVLAVQKL